MLDNTSSDCTEDRSEDALLLQMSSLKSLRIIADSSKLQYGRLQGDLACCGCVMIFCKEIKDMKHMQHASMRDDKLNQVCDPILQ